jgi:TRAP-type C4-dicarboxylate transport system permease small subunit
MLDKPAGDVEISVSNPLLKILDKASYWSSLWFERVAMLGIAGIIISTLIDVLGDKLFNHPLEAGTEVVYFLQIIAIAGGLAMAQIDNRHIRLEFVDSLPGMAKAIFHFVSALLGLALFIVLSWKSLEYALALKQVNEVTAASRIPLFPFVLWVAISCLPLCLVLFKGMVNSLFEVIRR